MIGSAVGKTTSMRYTLITLLVGSLCFVDGASISAQEAGTKRALLLCGLTGEDEFKEQFVDSVSRIRSALMDRFRFDAANIRVQFGRSEEEPALSEFPNAGRTTREEIAAEAKRLVEDAQETDSTWVFVIGHAYFDGRTSFFNIPDRDIAHDQFGRLFKDLKGQATFFICTPVSGYYIKGLSGTNRVVITATDADLETNGSVFHTALAKAMTEISQATESDLDKNGVVSLLDLFLKTTQNLSDLYLENDPPLIATEHPLLDDDGDGRGSELQIDYLTIAQGGRSDAKRRRNIRKFKDGKLAARWDLNLNSRQASSTAQ